MRREELRELPKAAREYCNYLLGVRGRSQLTVLEYAGDLRTFFRWLIQNRNLLEDKSTPWEKIPLELLTAELLGSVELAEVYEFLAFCKDIKQNSAKTRARKVVALRRFYKYLEVQKILPDNPLKNLEAPGGGKKSLPKYLTLDESRELLAAVEGRHKERDTAIITLFLHCGLRLAELVGINLGDIREDKLNVRGKGNKERMVYLNSACVKALTDYLPARAEAIKAQEAGIRKREAGQEATPAPPLLPADTYKALFLSAQMKRIGRRTVQHIVYQFLDKAGLAEPGMSAHKLRHTAATLLYQHGGVDVRLLQKLLGHENLGTTQIYTHVSDEQLREAQGKNPLI